MGSSRKKVRTLQDRSRGIELVGAPFRSLEKVQAGHLALGFLGKGQGVFLRLKRL
jgi:hypothetical protein